jgi:hypothetical protein
MGSIDGSRGCVGVLNRCGVFGVRFVERVDWTAGRDCGTTLQHFGGDARAAGCDSFEGLTRQFNLRRRAGSANRSPVLKALAAEYGTSLRGLEGNGRLFATLRANRFGFDSLNGCRTRIGALRAICFARLASLGFVLEALIGEKHLFAGGKYEFSSALGTLQDLVVEFHWLPLGRVRTRQGGMQHDAGGRMSAELKFWRSSARWQKICVESFR